MKILFPMKYLNITQGYGYGTHVGSNAIDNAGADTGVDTVYAPYSGTIKKIWPNGNTIWLESDEPVEFADGTIDYATSFYTHDNFVGDLVVGQHFNQSEPFYQEGTAGNASGNHVHMEIAKGKFTGSGWYQNAQGYWVLNNSVPPEDAFFLNENIILNGFGYDWKWLPEEKEVIANTDEANLLYVSTLFRNPETEAVAAGLVGKDWSDEVRTVTDSEEWQGKRDIINYKYPDSLAKITDLEKQLAEKPKEVVITKEVKVEVPVEKIVIKEVNVGDKNRTFWDLIKAAFGKIGEK